MYVMCQKQILTSSWNWQKYMSDNPLHPVLDHKTIIYLYFKCTSSHNKCWWNFRPTLVISITIFFEATVPDTDVSDKDGDSNREHDTGICCVPGILLLCMPFLGIFCPLCHFWVLTKRSPTRGRWGKQKDIYVKYWNVNNNDLMYYCR